MSHWLMAPILLPLVTGLVLLLAARWPLARQRSLSVVSSVALLPLAGYLLALSLDDGYRLYALGNWPAPFGIVLVLDRLSALMLALVALLAVPAVLYAVRGTDTRGRNFHALFQFQLLGLNGAFLTGDLFNLFVFFEVLLIASYALLLHGGGAPRSRAGLHYVVLNLIGSSLFLVAVGVLYGITGTLNMADLAARVAQLSHDEAGLVHAGALLLLVVFALKAALLPLYFWLPRAYAAASAPVAALFAIMTKVGVYAIVRVYSLIFGPAAGLVADTAATWLWPLALATLALGAIGALAARDLRTLIAYLVVVSVGTLLAGFALGTPDAWAATLYYMVHTTLVSGGLFLLAGLVRAERGTAGDGFADPHPLHQPALLGALFFLGAVAVVGMPPLSGFIGKLLLLRATVDAVQTAWLWSVVLGSGLLALIALSRAGSLLFWRVGAVPLTGVPADRLRVTCSAVLLASAPLLVIFAAPATDFAEATARQLSTPAGYVSAVLGAARAPGGAP
ncbi:MAG: monovalent cation/H+ antiporter subunit D [Gammaproteobacteria bacterium]